MKVVTVKKPPQKGIVKEGKMTCKQRQSSLPMEKQLEVTYMQINITLFQDGYSIIEHGVTIDISETNNQYTVYVVRYTVCQCINLKRAVTVAK